MLHQPDKSQRERGRAETLALCHRKPAVVDTGVIHQLQDALKQLALDAEEGPKLWEQANSAKPMDDDLLKQWLDQSIADSNWRSAQKVGDLSDPSFDLS